MTEKLDLIERQLDNLAYMQQAMLGHGAARRQATLAQTYRDLIPYFEGRCERGKRFYKLMERVPNSIRAQLL